MKKYFCFKKEFCTKDFILWVHMDVVRSQTKKNKTIGQKPQNLVLSSLLKSFFAQFLHLKNVLGNNKNS